MYEYQAELVRVIDADTYELDIDLGFLVHVKERVRLRGANAPERFTPEGRAATAFVHTWFVNTKNLVVLETYKGDLNDKYGRWVADLIGVDGHGLAEDLIHAGHAVPFLP